MAAPPVFEDLRLNNRERMDEKRDWRVKAEDQNAFQMIKGFGGPGYLRILQFIADG